MYPSIAFNVLYQTESQAQSVRSLWRLPEHLLRDLGVSRGGVSAVDKKPTIGSMTKAPNSAKSRM